LLKSAARQHHLGQFSQKQRPPIGLAHNLLHPHRRQRLPARDVLHHHLDVRAFQATERERREVGARSPGRDEIGPKGEDCQQPGGGHLIEEEREYLQCRGIGPVHVFPDVVDWFLCRLLDDPRYQRFLRLLLLLLRTQRDGGRAFGMVQREQDRQQWQRIGLRETIGREDLLEFAELGLGGLFAVKLQEPLEVLDDRIQRTVWVIGRAAKLNADCAFSDSLLFERLHQAGLANAGLATEQHDLAGALLSLLPASPQQSEFLFAAHQRGQALVHRRLKATLRFALTDDPVHRQREGEAFQLLRATVLALEQPLYQAIRRSADNSGIRLGQPLEPRSNVRALAQRTHLAFLTAPNFANND